MSNRVLLAKLLEMTAATKLLERYHFDSRGWLRILHYHRVLDINPAHYPFDEEIVSASVEQFDAQMRYVGRHFVPITFQTLLECLRERYRLPPQAVIVTFDDGYEDNYWNAFPILKKYGIPATIFLATEYIGKNDIFWFEKLAYWFKHTTRLSVDLKTLALSNLNLNSGSWSRSLPVVRQHLMRLDNGTRLRALEEIERELDVEIAPEDRHWATTLNWEQVREMSASGIEMGSHSKSHAALAHLSAEELKGELQFSKLKIEAETGREVISLAYPFGKGDAFDGGVKQAAQGNGYIFGVASLPGVNEVSVMDWFEMKRIPIETGVTLALFKSNLLLPWVFAQ